MSPDRHVRDLFSRCLIDVLRSLFGLAKARVSFDIGEKTTMNIDRKQWGVLILGIAFCLSFGSVAQAESFETLAKRLATLRGDVEGLSAKLSEKNAEYSDQVRSYQRQKADLELEVQREQTRLGKLQAAVAEKQAMVTAQKAAGAKLEPLFAASVAQVRTYVDGALPFRTKQRQAELDTLAGQLRSGLLTPERALMRLWTFVEDELRLTRESGLYQQTITLDGEAQLAEVLRVGMVMLFFRTGDGRYGYVERADTGWRYETVSGKESVAQIEGLFDQFKKQIRVGYFTLPNALGETR